MIATLICKCGYRTETNVNDAREAEILADVHESIDVTRPYRHGPRRGERSIVTALVLN